MKNSPVTNGAPHMGRAAARWIAVDDQFAGQRLDNFLMARLRDVPRTTVYRMVRRGEVRVNSGRVSPGYRIRAGDRVRIPPLHRSANASGAQRRPREFPVSFADRVLMEDDHLLILDKPAGVAVHSGSGVAWGVIDVVRRERPELHHVELVHRLDRETSGCLILAKKREALKALHADLRENSARNHRVDKRYLALLCGHWTAPRVQEIVVPLRRTADRSGERRVVVDPDGQYAKTVVRLRRQGDETTLAELQLLTGRTHQARVHCAHAGHPIAGDVKYGDDVRNRMLREMGLRRLFLHAARISFVHPIHGHRVTVDSALPPDLEAFLVQVMN